MTSINVNRNVYDAVNKATDDVTLMGLRSRNISASEMKDIEKAVAADGQVSGDEAKLLDAIKNGETVTLQSNGQSSTLDPSEVTFPDRSAVSNVREGRVTIDQENGALQNLPDYVPRQRVGAGTDVYHREHFDTPADADAAFTQAKTRLLDVNNWDKYSKQENTVMGYSPTNANFNLYDSSGSPVSRPARQGDFIKIAPKLPGAPPIWVQIENVVDRPNEFAIQVRPSRNPTDPSGSPDIAHIYTDNAMNTFRLTREPGNDVRVGFHGRNEEVNHGSGTADRIMNTVSDYGLYYGGRSVQWGSLGEGVLPGKW